MSYFVFHYFVGRKDSYFQEEIEIPTISVKYSLQISGTIYLHVYGYCIDLDSFQYHVPVLQRLKIRYELEID